MSDTTISRVAADVPSSTVAPARERRLLEGAATLRRRTAAVVDGERVLFTLGAVMVPVGFLLIMVAWWGASDTGAVFEQIPFLISGGLGGLGLMVAGGFLYNGWWLTRQVREAREQHRDLLERHEQLARNNAELAAAVQALSAVLRDDRQSRRAPLRADR